MLGTVNPVFSVREQITGCLGPPEDGGERGGRGGGRKADGRGAPELSEATRIFYAFIVMRTPCTDICQKSHRVSPFYCKSIIHTYVMGSI